MAAAAAASATSGLTVATMNERILKAEYAVRGPIVVKAVELDRTLRKGGAEAAALPFDRVIFCNIGNPHQLAQAPLTFPRQVLSLVTSPGLLESPDALKLFPADAVARAKAYLKEIPGGTGAYSHSKGVEVVRREVASFIAGRDGFRCDPENVFLTDGASPGVKMMITSMVRGPKDGVMIPIPQYPLYSATLALEGGAPVGYYLDESKGWSTSLAALEEAFARASSAGVTPRGLVVINPGNPTGGCMDRAVMEDVCRFASDRGLVLLADEVYQDNVWRDDRSFISFRKVACEMGLLNPENPNGSDGARIQLASFHSVSKGFVGECGRRGGYLELCGFDSGVLDQLYKLASISLCSNLDGQLMVGLMVNPPKDGDASFALWAHERDSILASLKRRAARLATAFGSMRGISCAQPEGALYAFPRIELPAKAVAAALERGVAADAFYCMELLSRTGIVVVPGSGFGQAEGTFHFRTTILPPEDQIDAVVERLRAFHDDFLTRFK